MILDEGMGEAYCRALADEKATTGLLLAPGAALDLASLPPLSAAGRALALSRARQCLVLDLARWDESVAVLELWLPWLHRSVLALGPLREMDLAQSYGVAVERPDELPPALLAVLLEANACDVELRAVLEAAFEAQLAVLGSQAFR